jgi:hypothetical protein
MSDCSICFDDYDFGSHIPRILPCGHSFCQECLENLRRRALSLSTSSQGSLSSTSVSSGGLNSTTSTSLSAAAAPGASPPPPPSPTTPISPSPTIIECPTCKASHSIISVESIPKNFSLFPPTSPSTEITRRCDVCQDPHEATHKCLDCGEFMCGKLGVQHLKYKISKDHRVVTLSEAQSLLAEGANLSSLMCLEHPTDPYQFYDEICKQLVCVKCVVFGTHMGHKCRPIAEVSGEFQQLHAKISADLSNQTQVLKSAEDMTQDESLTLHIHFEELSKQINQYFGQLQQKILHQKNHLQTQLEEIHSTLGSTFEDHLEKIRIMRESLQSVIAQSVEIESETTNEKEYVRRVLQLQSNTESLGELSRSLFPLTSSLEGPSLPSFAYPGR